MTYLEADLLAQAHDQAEMFTTRHARGFGLTARMLERAAARGECRRVIRGVFATTKEPVDREGKLRELTLAMLLANEHAAATGRSAAALHGLPLYGVNFARAQGVWTNDNATRSTTQLIVRRPLVVPAVGKVGRWLTVDPPWALVDLARDAGVVAGVVAMDAALRVGLTTVEEVSKTIDALRAAHRLDRARQMVAAADGVRESPGESRLGVILETAGFDLEAQFELRRYWSGRRAFADFRVKGTKVLIEFDGQVKYGGD